MPIGGKLVLKGGPGDKKKKKRRREMEEAKVEEGEASKTGGEEVGEEEGRKEQKVDLDAGLTPAQKRHMKKMEERDNQRIKEMVSKTHRERVEEFNSYLGSLTEHNDIPRVSAAGNG